MSTGSTSNHFAKALNHINRYLANQKDPSPDIIFCGDFNLPHTAWPECVPQSGASPDERSMIDCLAKFASDNFLVQKVLVPTHERGNILDLIFVNNDSAFVRSECSQSSITDHFFVDCLCRYSAKSCTYEL